MNEAADAELEEQEEEECPKCPPVGAPAWMATFADMATLLMAFFVLILSFAEFNVPKFKQISGSLKNAFGVQRVVPIVEQPKGTTVLSLNFSPSPSPSVTQDMTQQTTDITKPDLDVKQREKDQDGGESQAAEDVVKALEDAIARGDIEVEVLGENVVVNFTPTEATDEELPNLLQQTLAPSRKQSRPLANLIRMSCLVAWNNSLRSLPQRQVTRWTALAPSQKRPRLRRKNRKKPMSVLRLPKTNSKLPFVRKLVRASLLWTVRKTRLSSLLELAVPFHQVRQN